MKTDAQEYIRLAIRASNLPLNDPCYQALLCKAIKASNNAYCPYSNFRVGAALLTVKHGIYAGCNVENAMYNGMSHAELTAISAAIVDEGPDMRIVEMIVWTPTETPTPSCGGCRQLIREHASGRCIVYAYGKNPALGRLAMTVDEMLPHSFGPENLEEVK